MKRVRSHTFPSETPARHGNQNLQDCLDDSSNRSACAQLRAKPSAMEEIASAQGPPQWVAQRTESFMLSVSSRLYVATHRKYKNYVNNHMPRSQGSQGTSTSSLSKLCSCCSLAWTSAMRARQSSRQRHHTRGDAPGNSSVLQRSHAADAPCPELFQAPATEYLSSRSNCVFDGAQPF